MSPSARLARQQAMHIVGVADLKVSDDPASVIVTYALGSCIALCLWDPERRVGGMIHYMLPLSKLSPEKAAGTPAMFADTGIPLLFSHMFELGCRRDSLVVKVTGGSALNGEDDHFQIGKRNHTVLRQLLWKNRIMINAEDVGGTRSRTVRLFVGDGRVVVSSQGEDSDL